MSRDYIEALRAEYENLFAHYKDAPVLTIDTDALDLVSDVEARAGVKSQVQNALQGAQQSLFPEMADNLTGQPGHRLMDFQRHRRSLEHINGDVADIFYDYLSLSQDVGRLGDTLKQVWMRQDELLPKLGNRQEARDLAVEALAAKLKETLGDTLDRLLKIANDAGVDLESAYLGTLERTDPGKDAVQP